MDLDSREEQRIGGQNVCLTSQTCKVLKLIISRKKILRRVTERKINLTLKRYIFLRDTCWPANQVILPSTANN